MTDLTLVHELETHEDQPLPGCQRVPQWWVPYTGVEHSGTTVGVKFWCPQCGLEGEGVFGPARDFIDTAIKARVLFMAADEVQLACAFVADPGVVD